MNHDASHCSDYDKDTCPKGCYRAKLTEDLQGAPYMVGVPVEWSSFYGSEECPIRHHGLWIKTDSCFWICSSCQSEYNFRRPFCCWCGAHMDGWEVSL